VLTVLLKDELPPADVGCLAGPVAQPEPGTVTQHDLLVTHGQKDGEEREFLDRIAIHTGNKMC